MVCEPIRGGDNGEREAHSPSVPRIRGRRKGGGQEVIGKGKREGLLIKKGRMSSGESNIQTGNENASPNLTCGDVRSTLEDKVVWDYFGLGGRKNPVDKRRGNEADFAAFNLRGQI